MDCKKLKAGRGVDEEGASWKSCGRARKAQRKRRGTGGGGAACPEFYLCTLPLRRSRHGLGAPATSLARSAAGLRRQGAFSDPGPCLRLSGAAPGAARRQGTQVQRRTDDCGCRRRGQILATGPGNVRHSCSSRCVREAPTCTVACCGLRKMKAVAVGLYGAQPWHCAQHQQSRPWLLSWQAPGPRDSVP